MKTLFSWITRAAEFVAAMMMAAMFATFILQIAIRYSARLDWVAGALPWLDPGRYGWTLEFCLLMWLWIVFWGNSFITRERDHVSFDILYDRVGPGLRKWFAIVSALAITIGLLAAFLPTWEKFRILRLKNSPTLGHVFGDWIRMRDVYMVFFLFLAMVPLRYGLRAWSLWRHGADADRHHYKDPAGE